MKFNNYYFVLVALFFSCIVTAQEFYGPIGFGTTENVVRVPSLASRAGSLLPPDNTAKEAKDRRSVNTYMAINNSQKEQDDVYAQNPHPSAQSIEALPPSLVFDAYTSNGQPTDPAIAVGPNHIFAVWNTAMRIYDKNGTALTNVLNVNSIFSGGGCCDLTASYDQEADRFVLSYLFFNGTVQVAVSTGPDPVNEAWNVYTINNVQDYNKLSVGPNAYYITANTSPQRVWALNRDEIVLGNTTATFQIFNIPGFVGGPLFNAPQVANVSDSQNSDSPGTLVHMADNSWSGAITTDHVKVWTVDVDFDVPGNSTISSASEINLAPFISTFDGGSFDNLAQPGGSSIDAIQNTIMNQAQIRKFGTHNSLLLNFVVDTDGGAGELAGIRWVELRQANDASPWALHQEGTYTSPDGKHAWMGSMIMDSAGNIALGYSAMSGPSTPSTVRVSSYYTGRMDGDPLGTMTIAEEEIRLGSGNIPGIRYGDYAKMDIDPNGSLDFWFITELNSSGRKGVVGKFTFTPTASRDIEDIGVIDIVSPRENDGVGNSEEIEVQIHNFGTEAVTNPELQYAVDGNTPVVENYSGTIQPGETVNYTFTALADMSSTSGILLTSQSNLATDDVLSNDDTRRRYGATLGVDTPLASSDLIIRTLPNNIFEISLNTVFNDLLSLTVYNSAGQKVGYSDVAKEGSTYNFTLDMSYAASGVYLVQLGDRASGAYQTGKIIVK